MGGNMPAPSGGLGQPQPFIGGVMPSPSGSLTVHHVRMWSQIWWHEAVRASSEPAEDPHVAIAKEILFAVTFAEAFIVEWVRDIVLSDERRKFEILDGIFPPDDRNSSTDDRWKVAPKLLLAQGRIKGVADRSDTADHKQWLDLLDWRHWLVHAAASRPDVFVDGEEKGVARLKAFQLLSRGWATSVVAEQVCRLNGAAGTRLPQALEDLPGRRY